MPMTRYGGVFCVVGARIGMARRDGVSKSAARYAQSEREGE